MRVLRKIIPGVLIVALLYGALLVAERLTTQELTRVSNATTQEAACLMWQPRLLRGDGICSLSLLNSQGQVLDTARLGILGAGFEALQRFGQLGFQEQKITVADMRTGELLHTFAVRDGRLAPAQ